MPYVIKKRFTEETILELPVENLSSAKLTKKNLANANLKGANLAYADLSGANLRNANLENANLERANLRNAKLEAADMNGVNLYGADLTGATLSVSARCLNPNHTEGILRISGSRHPVVATSKGVWIGCENLRYDSWKKVYREIGHDNGYTAEQIEEYKLYLQLCDKMFNKKKNK